MRKTVHYIILLTLVLSACTSADHEAMRQRLQYVSDCNRADTVFSARWFPTVDSLVAYFDRRGSANDRMMAHYVQGRVYHDMGEAPQALECYQRAAEQADTSRINCDLYTLTAIYSQMSDLYDAQYLPDDEMQALYMSERLAWKDKDTLSALVAYELRIRPYFLRKDTDSIIYIANHAYQKFTSYHLAEKSQLSLPIIINLCLDRKEYGRAGNAIRLYEEESEQFDSQGNIVKGREIYYYDKGRYELAKGNTESAITYFNKTLHGGYDEAGYRGLLSVYEKLGYPDSISKYAKLFAAANDSSFLHVNQQQVEQVRAMYNYNRQKRIAEETTQKLKKAHQEKVIIILTLVLLLSTSFIVVRKLRNRDKRKYAVLAAEFEEKQRKLAEAIDRLRLLNYDHEKDMKERLLEHAEQELLIKQHEENVREKNQEIKSLEVKVQELESKLQQYSSVDMEAAFKRTSIYKLFEKRRNPKYVNDLPSEKDWEELTTLFRTYFVRYYSFIAIKHRLPVNQFRYCILLRLGFDGSDIGILMDKDRDQRYNLRKFIYEELFGKPVQVRLLEEKLKQHF